MTGRAKVVNETPSPKDVSRQPGLEKEKYPKEVLFLFSVGGIFICYFLFGILQEKVQKTNYGENKERFSYTFVLLFWQCVFSAVASGLQLIVTKEKKVSFSAVPQYKFIIISLTYLTAMFASNAALSYVDYPTQVLSKSCKPIPVMLVGFLFLAKKYKWYQWTSVLFLVIGISLFTFKDNANSVGKELNSEYMYGIALLLLSLLCDGFTGPLQDRVFSDFRLSSTQMMFFNNIYAALYTFIGMIVTGQAVEAYIFCSKYPQVLVDIILFSIAAAVGQNFIYLTIAKFSALICSIATTSRKFFTILGSVIIFGHELRQRQWLGVCLVFFGLGLEIFITYYEKWRLSSKLKEKKN